MTSVFLSHSSRDKATARRVAVDLSMSDISVWFDEWRIVVGDSITQKVSRGLDDTDFVVVLLSKHSVESGWVEKEWMSRVGDEAGSRNVAILPVLLEDCGIPRLLRDKKYADIRAGYESGIRDLIEGVKHHAFDQKPISAGARVSTGSIVFETTRPHLPHLNGLINTIESGCFERFESGLRAHVRIIASHAATQQLAEATGLNKLVLESSDYAISSSSAAPTELIGEQSFVIQRGMRVLDPATGQLTPLPFQQSGRTRTVVRAWTSSGEIIGDFAQKTRFDNGIPVRVLECEGSFRAVIAL